MCYSSSSTRPLVKQLVFKDLYIHVPSTSQRRQERRSGKFISRAREQCTVCGGGRKTVQGPLNHVSKPFSTVMSAKALSVRETERVV